MNSADNCHQVTDCPGLFVDAFRGHFLRDHTKNPDATFVLSHYHGDHYQSLPREGKYRGPAKIHCTPVTARLLINVHDVPEKFVVEHQYGTTFQHPIVGDQQKKENGTRDELREYADITFYDANHCPGACIILIQLPDGKTTHLHTGDMRYCSMKFHSYPLLTRAIKERKLDLVYLDTTYCHPKHDFITQDKAVDSIASQTQKLLLDKSPEKTLVLLSCYSIGKEKVLYEASKRSEQLIYVSEKKWRMLQCIQQDKSECKVSYQNHDQFSSMTHEQHTNILERCTRDRSSSDLHVIPMGLAGEMFPYFQPAFQKIAKYVEDLSSVEFKAIENGRKESTTGERTPRKEYDRVVAFIPTGWANASNWNKKNAISTKEVELSSSRVLHVEVRLISYSEHSTFPELVSFVQHLKPRKIIPTVYSDENHKRQIEGRFRNLLDSTRVKEAFFRSMRKKNTITSTPSIITNLQNSKGFAAFGFEPMNDHSEICQKGMRAKEEKSIVGARPADQKNFLVGKDESDTSTSCKPNNKADNDEIEVVGVVQAKNSSVLSSSLVSRNRSQRVYDDEIKIITSMGFDRQRAKVVLEKCNGNLQEAMGEILSSGPKSRNDFNDLTKLRQRGIGSKVQSQPSTDTKKRKISDFFFRKNNEQC